MADNLPPSCAVVTKFGNLNFLEPSGPVQACNGTVLHIPNSSNSSSCCCCSIPDLRKFGRYSHKIFLS